MLRLGELAERKLDAAALGERAGIDEIETLRLGDAEENADRGGGREHVARAHELGSGAQREPPRGADPTIRQNRARERGGALCQLDRRAQFRPASFAGPWDVDRARELSRDQRVSNAAADVDGDVPP